MGRPPSPTLITLGRLVRTHRDAAGLPTWFRPWLEEEARASALRWVELSIIPGILQTEEYARALLGDDESAVRARMERQKILDREDPPRMHFVIDEAVLYRERGGPEVMRAQLEHLLKMVSRRVTIQIVRSKDNPHSMGAFTLATVDGSEVAYVETAVRGIVTRAREDIERLSEIWETVRAFALPQQESIEFIQKTAEERWT